MPNEKVKFLKRIDEIKEKIIFIKDKDLLGFDSANIFAFTFNLYKLEKFGISRNFIYMEDDFFIGKPLKKRDFFYYNKENNKVLPFLLNFHFKVMNKNDILRKYQKLFQMKDKIHPHSKEGWYFSTYSTDLYFLEKYKKTIITINFTHNAISENLDDLKEIFKEIQDYKYINETLFSKERSIFTLNQPHFVDLYQLNIKHKKVHPIPYKYIEMERINKIKINSALFVINTGGNHKPITRQYKFQKKIMEKLFPYQIKYELKFNFQNNKTLRKKIFVIILKLCLLFIFIKIIN